MSRSKWRPFLLGPIFKSQGWTTSPFNIYPAKGRYMVRDVEPHRGGSRTSVRNAGDVSGERSQGRPARPRRAKRGSKRAPFSRAMFAAEFAEGSDISDDAVLTACLTSCGLDSDVLWR